MGKTGLAALLLLTVFSFPFPGFSQDPFQGGYYWVSFTDKENNPFSVDQPEAFLSSRSISRRMQQGLPVTEADLPPNPAYLDSLKADDEVEVWYASRWFNGALIHTTAESSIERIRSLSFVAETELVKPAEDAVMENQESYPASVNKRGAQGVQKESLDHAFIDLSGNDSWKGHFPGLDPGYSRATLEQINGVSLLEEGFRGAGKLIAVLDAGFYSANQLSAFSSLWASGGIAGIYDFVEKPGNIFGSSPHGTYVLSVMAGLKPGTLMGTATEATYWLIRTEDARTEYLIEEYNWLAGAELADSVGADIINSSLGYTVFDEPTQNHTYQDLDGESTVVAKAANLAFERGILVVNSAGNYGNQSWKYIGSPADSFGALGVGAVNIEGTVAGFSSRGPTADGRIKPDIMAHGQGVPVADLSEGVGLASGTSFASPVIAGMAASLWGKHPDADVQEIKRAIIESSHLYFQPDTIYGHGIPDFNWASRLLQYDFQPEEKLVVFPNPVSPSSFISYHSEIHQPYLIEIFDIRGQLVFISQRQTFFPGYNRIQPFGDLIHLDNGIYFLRMILVDSGEFSVAKFLKAW